MTQQQKESSSGPAGRWTTVYDIRQEPAPIRNQIRGGIAGSLVCALLLLLVWKRRERAPKVLASVFLLAWAGFCAANAVRITRAHREAQQLLSRGGVEVAEGVVEDLAPAPGDGTPESFRVGSRTFLVTDGDTGEIGLARPVARGGPVRAGAHVRIAARGRAILRVEVLR